jgi:hypothetical protein
VEDRPDEWPGRIPTYTGETCDSNNDDRPSHKTIWVAD